jgi:predicted component of type VI protein secretion system
MQVALKVIEGKQTGTLIPLNRQKFLIGREEDCQLRPNSDLVSRHHCVIAVDDFTVRIRDLGSTNGTFVNNQRITTQVVLKQGDSIRIGKLAFEMQIRTVATPAKVPQPVPEPVAIDYTLPSQHALADSSGSDTKADFAIPHQLDAALDQTTQMFGGDTTIVSGAQVDAAAKQPAQRPVAPALRLPDPSQIPDPMAPVPAAPAPAAAAGGQPGPVDSRNSAADIIRQYMQRRPG